jgi:hypothetical protein
LPDPVIARARGRRSNPWRINFADRDYGMPRLRAA